jgi:hypothetical protein
MLNKLNYINRIRTILDELESYVKFNNNEKHDEQVFNIKNPLHDLEKKLNEHIKLYDILHNRVCNIMKHTRKCYQCDGEGLTRFLIDQGSSLTKACRDCEKCYGSGFLF